MKKKKTHTHTHTHKTISTWGIGLLLLRARNCPLTPPPPHPPPQPTHHERKTTPTGSTSPTLFEQQCEFISSPSNLIRKDEGDKAYSLWSPPNEAVIWFETRSSLAMNIILPLLG